VDRQHVGQRERVEVAEVVGHGPAVEVDRHLLLVRVDLLHQAEVAVEHLAAVVVLGLDHAVAHAELPAKALHLLLAARRIEDRLEHLVQIARAQRRAIHGAEDLHVPLGIEAETGRDPLPHQAHDQVLHCLRLGGLDEVEIAEGLRGGQLGHLPAVDGVGRGHDAAALGLAEDLGEPRHGHSLRGDDVQEHRARAHRRELIHVAHQDHARLAGNRLEVVVPQGDIDHRGLVEHEQVAFQGPVAVALELAGERVELEQTVDGLGLAPGHLGQALGRPARGRGQHALQVLGLEDLEDAPHERGLADAGPAGDDQQLVPAGLAHGLLLAFGEAQPQAFFDPGHGLFEVDLGQRMVAG